GRDTRARSRVRSRRDAGTRTRAGCSRECAMPTGGLARMTREVKREATTRDRPAIAVVLTGTQRLDLGVGRDPHAGLRERDVRADLRVRVAADRERLAVARDRAGLVAQLALRISRDEQR